MNLPDADEATRRSTPSPSRSEDLALARRIAGGDEDAFELLMRRHNQLLFRTARSVLRHESDAEDAVQEAYLKAFRAIATFEGRSSLATWLVRITMNEALTRSARKQRIVQLPSVAGPHDEVADDVEARETGWLGDRRRRPEEATGDGELRAVLLEAVDRLPETLRTVFVLRGVEEMSVEETAESLGLSPEAVRVRYHRARTALRERIDEAVSAESRELFSFGHVRCDRLVARVLERVRALRA